MEALYRGWIFQELAFGSLDRGIVEAFVRRCISNDTRQLLKNFVRRRPYAIAVLIEIHTWTSDRTKAEEEFYKNRVALYEARFITPVEDWYNTIPNSDKKEWVDTNWKS